MTGDMSRGSRYAVVFLFFLTLALAACNLLFTATLVHRIDENKVSITQACMAANQARADQVNLWTFIIQVSGPPPHETPAQRTQRRHVLHQFALQLHTIFAPRDCTKGTP